ncbi:hypothetical protein BYT27DRAFT_7128478 [Phlegmacium glaucopus]|nr:hypothetical protein BYT27DRAFT_7128478 [Phlegmacium glaucopus]
MFRDLRNAHFAGGTFIHTVQGNTGLLGEAFKILHGHIAPGAMHNSGDLFDQPKCHPKTRLAVRRTIMQWIHGLDGQSSSILWLYGATGTGKTAIARSISEHCEELGLLLATFFFSRTVEGCNNTRQFIPTIAYQLTQTIPTTLQYIERAVEKDPSIFDKTLKHQVQALIVHPLKSSNSLPNTSLLPLKPPTPYLLVIDGLDECEDPLAHIHVLKILGSLHDLPLKILIVSRPERHIRAAFETGSLSKLSIKLALDHSFKPDDDIQLFLSSEFDEIKDSHPFRSILPKSWPPRSIIDILVQKSAGQFIFAAAVIKFVASFDHPPHERLKDILGFCDDFTPGRLPELLVEGPILPHLLVSSGLPNSHVSESFSSSSTWTISSSSNNRESHFPLRRRSVSPFPSHLANAERFQRAASEPLFDRNTGLWRSMSRRAKHIATYSCPVPGCGAIFTRHLHFKVHLRTHKEEQNDSSRYSYPSSSSGRSRAFVRQLNCKRHECDLLPTGGDHFQSFQCMGCRRHFPQEDALDRHLKSEIGVECMKVVESCRKPQDVTAPSTSTAVQYCWEMEMEMEVEVDKGIGTTEMEVD